MMRSSGGSVTEATPAASVPLPRFPISGKAFRQLLAATLREFIRDRSAVFWSWIFVFFFAVIFAMIMGYHPGSTVRVGVVTSDHPLPARLARGLEATHALQVSTLDATSGEAELKAGHVDALVRVLSDETGSVHVAIDAANGLRNRGLIAALVEASTVTALNSESERARFTLDVRQGAAVAPPTALQLFFPALIAFLIMRLGVFNTPIPLVSMRVQGMIRRLSLSPLTPLTLISAHVAGRVIIITVQVAVILVFAALCGVAVPLLRWGLFLAMFVLATGMFVSLGVVVASLARSQESCTAIASVLQVPMIFLSGALIPLQATPRFLQPVVAALPTTHIVDAFNQIMLQTPPTYGLVTNTVVLFGWMALSMAFAARYFSLDGAQ